LFRLILFQEDDCFSSGIDMQEREQGQVKKPGNSLRSSGLSTDSTLTTPPLSCAVLEKVLRAKLLS